MYDFSGMRAVVTGGSNGIGASVVRALTELGARVLVFDVESPSSAEVEFLHVDLAATSSVLTSSSSAIETLGGVDVLVNCAGTFTPRELLHLDIDSYERTLDVNLHAPILLMREFGQDMVSRGFGRIVNVTSIHSRFGEPLSLSYDVSKAGLEAATRSGAIELAAAGVLVNAVAPGFVATRMSLVNGQDELQSDAFRSIYVDNAKIPLARAAQPDEIAAHIVWLASRTNTYVTGQVVRVDGGLTATF